MRQLPALRGEMGGTEYFIVSVPLRDLPGLVRYAEVVDGWTDETPPEQKIQRVRNPARMRQMARYLLEDPDHLYGALVAESRTPLSFTPLAALPGIGLLGLPDDAVLHAIDGQHRLGSVELALAQAPGIGEESIALLIVPFRGVRHSQARFVSLNRGAQQVEPSLLILFEHREAAARLTRALATTPAVPFLHGRVHMEGARLAAHPARVVSLWTLYEMVRSLLDGQTARALVDEAGTLAELIGIIDVLVSAIPAWRAVAQGLARPGDLRASDLSLHGVTFQALGLLVAGARRDLGDLWPAAVREGLWGVDWRLVNPQWLGVATQAGRQGKRPSVNNTAASVRALARELGRHLSLPLGGPAGA